MHKGGHEHCLAVVERPVYFQCRDVLSKRSELAFLDRAYFSLRIEHVHMNTRYAEKTVCNSASRITGGGFGGCTVSIVKNDAIDTFIGEIGPVYEKETGHKAEFYIVDIGDGAHKLS